MNYYYHPDPETTQVFDKEESQHIVKSMRKSKGDSIHLMDGKGSSYEVEITDDNFRKCVFKIVSKHSQSEKNYAIQIAIAPTKNIDRIEWFVEKACELGITKIWLIQTKRTERSKVNVVRLEKKAISAMKQSKSFWKCEIEALQSFKAFLESDDLPHQKFVAHVDKHISHSLASQIEANQDAIVLIGPEGDFDEQEINSAKEKGFLPIHLGKNVLRTETAGIIAVHTFNIINEN